MLCFIFLFIFFAGHKHQLKLAVYMREIQFYTYKLKHKDIDSGIHVLLQFFFDVEKSDDTITHTHRPFVSNLK